MALAIVEGLLAHLEALKPLVVIVEGRKDKAALSKLGVINVVVLDRPLYAVVESIPEKAHGVAILTDLDSEGKKLYSRLSGALRERGFRIDDSVRNFLFRNTQLRQIEGLASYIERRQDRHG